MHFNGVNSKNDASARVVLRSPSSEIKNIIFILLGVVQKMQLSMNPYY